MRSLFHFPLPCTTTLAVTVSYSNRPTAPEMSRRPHPAPMRRQRRSPVLLSAARPLPDPALTGPRPIVARSQGARHAAPPSPPRAAARSHCAPSPEYRPAAARSHWARLARIAPIAPAVRRHPHPPMSPPSRFRAHRPPITTIVCRRRLIRVALRRPHRAHRAPTSASPSRVASAPGPWLARTAPHASLFRRMREKGPLPGNIRSKCMLFEIKMATSSPHASIPGRNRAIQDTWRANLAAKGPFSRRGARNHAWREGVASAARPFCGSGLRSGGTGFAPCGAGLACLPHAPPLSSRLCPPRPAACGTRHGRTAFAPCSHALPSETRHAVPVPMHLATCAPHPSRQPRGPTASRKQAEQHKQLNAGIKIGSPNGDPIEELFGFAQRLPDALQSLHQANELALSYLDHSTRQRLGGYVIGLSGNSFTVDLYAALVDHATSIAR